MKSKNEHNNFFHQYYAGVFANFLTIIYGITLGWTSPTIPILESDDSPLSTGPATIEQISWITSSLSPGGMIGTLTYSFVSNWLGRKRALMLVALPQLISWLIIEFSLDIRYLYLARFLGGYAGGALMCVIPVFLTEISDDKVRGRIGSIFAVAFNMGILIGYITGSYLSYFQFPIVPILIIIAFIVGFWFVAESPSYLLSKSKLIDAEKALEYYSGAKGDNESQKLSFEMKSLLKNREEADGESDLKVRDFLTPHFRNATILALFLATVAAANGCFVILNYSQSTFEKSGSNLSSSTSSIIVATVQLIGSLLGIKYIDRYGRRMLLMISMILSTVAYIVLGGYSFLEFVNFNMELFKWIPVVSLSFLIFVASFGTMSVPFFAIPEILPEKIRSSVMSLSMFVLWFVGFVQLKFYPSMLILVGMYSCMWFYAALNVLGAAVVVFSLPETKGKSADEIKEMLSKSR